MYGTVARMRVKPGHDAQMRALNEERQQNPADGFVGAYVLRSDADPQEHWIVAVFRDRDVYRRNAEDPATDAQYRRMREHLEADPEWHDGEIIFSDSQGAGA